MVAAVSSHPQGANFNIPSFTHLTPWWLRCQPPWSAKGHHCRCALVSSYGTNIIAHGKSKQWHSDTVNNPLLSSLFLRETQHTPGAYPRHPLSPPKWKEFRTINCWLGVWGMLQGSVGKVLDYFFTSILNYEVLIDSTVQVGLWVLPIFKMNLEPPSSECWANSQKKQLWDFKTILLFPPTILRRSLVLWLALQPRFPCVVKGTLYSLTLRLQSTFRPWDYDASVRFSATWVLTWCETMFDSASHLGKRQTYSYKGWNIFKVLSHLHEAERNKLAAQFERTASPSL